MTSMEVDQGATPLMSACHAGQLHVVKKLLPKCNVQELDSNGRTALHYCVENTDTSCAEVLLGKDRTLINIQDASGYTPLHLAVIGGNCLLASFFIDNGAGVNTTDNEKHNSVHWAAVCGQLEILELLLSKRANVSCADVYGATPLHYAAQMGGSSGPDQQMDPEVSLKVLKKILSKGVPVDTVDLDGRQPLLWAASAGSTKACEALVKAGAKVDVMDKDGLTALHCAASRGHGGTVESLVLQCHLPVDIVDKNKCTALFYAITMGHIECARVLLDLGSDGNHKDRKGRSPAHCAASKGSVSALVLLKEKEANLWLANNNGDFPIHEAAIHKFNDMVRKFFATASNLQEALSSANQDRRTCLHIAATTDNLALCKILVEGGAKVNPLMVSKGKYLTPYDTAVMRSNKECADYLQGVGGTTSDKVSNHAASVIQRYTMNYINSKTKTEAPEEMEILSEGEEEIPPVVRSSQTSPVQFYVEPDTVDAQTLVQVETVDVGTSFPRIPRKDIVSKVQLSVIKYEVPRRLAREMQAVKKSLRDAPRKYDKAILHKLKVKEVKMDDMSDLESLHSDHEEEELPTLPSPIIHMEAEESHIVADHSNGEKKNILEKNRAEHRKQVTKHEKQVKEQKEKLELKMADLVKRTEEIFNTVNLEAAQTLSAVKEKNRTWEQHISTQKFVPSPRSRKPMLTQETKYTVEQEKTKSLETRARHRDYQARRAVEYRNKICKAYGQGYSYIFDNEKNPRMSSTSTRSSTSLMSRPKTTNTGYTMSPAQLRKVRSSKYRQIMTAKGVMNIREDEPMPGMKSHFVESHAKSLSEHVLAY